jgi:hypothetical protein
MNNLNPTYYDEIYNQMENRRTEVLDKLKLIVHPRFLNDFSKILCYSWQEGLPEAQTIAQVLNLFPIDFVAIGGNPKEFEPLFLEEKEDEESQYLYEEEYA